MRLYRYRSIDSAVKELSSKSFYFASKEELNDPLESYVRLYWKGDKPAWEGLFRNYSCSLFHALEMYLLATEKNILLSQTVLRDIHAFDQLPIGEIYKSVGEKFLEEFEVERLADIYGEHNLNCGTKELVVVLRVLHELAFQICIKIMVEQQLIPEEQGKMLLNTIKERPESAFQKFMAAGDIGNDNPLLTLDESKRRQLFADIENAAEDTIEQQLILIDHKRNKQNDFSFDVKGSVEAFLYKNEKDEKGSQLRNWLSIRGNYPRIYVDQLKEIVFPKSYVVCFSGNKDDSSMWGNYADNHRGVCLIYESDALNLSTKSKAETYDCLKHSFDYRNLTQRNEINVITGSNKTVYRPARVKPVTYGGDVLERNFFETLGELNLIQIEGWLKGTKRVSSIYSLYSSDKSDWREEYWKAAYKKTNTKQISWKHENEYRINLLDTAGVFVRPESIDEKLYEYEPKALKGVIFGINTSEYDKKRIFDTIPMECDISNDSDFGFFQAEYNDEEQKIEIRNKLIVIKRTDTKVTDKKDTTDENEFDDGSNGRDR